MEIHDFFNTSVRWMQEQGPLSDIVLSTRVRFARNIVGCHFGEKATPEMKKRILDKGKTVPEKSKSFKNGLFFSLDNLTQNQREMLVERHLIGPNFSNCNDFCGIVINKNESLSIIINEEDHFRIQLIKSGLQPDEALKELVKVDDELDKYFSFSFSQNWGYLTACPTNVGTGMRASVLIHLPALVLTKEITKVFNGISQNNFAVRGFYGEGTEVMGNLFQISNQVTLGVSELQISDLIMKLTDQVIEYEKKARRLLLEKARKQIEDKVFRGLGELKSARIISSRELLNLSSVIRLGISLGIIDNLSISQLNRIMLLSQPGHLQNYFKKNLNAQERDIYRADIIRDLLKNVII